MLTKCCIALLLAVVVTQAADMVQVFGTAHVEEVYRVLLDRDALLLESIKDVIKQKGVEDGQIFVTAGSVQECTYHYVTSIDQKPVNAYKTFTPTFHLTVRPCTSRISI